MSCLHVCHAEVRDFDWQPSVELPALRNTGYDFGDLFQPYASRRLLRILAEHFVEEGRAKGGGRLGCAASATRRLRPAASLSVPGPSAEETLQGLSPNGQC